MITCPFVSLEQCTYPCRNVRILQNLYLHIETCIHLFVKTAMPMILGTRQDTDINRYLDNITVYREN